MSFAVVCLLFGMYYFNVILQIMDIFSEASSLYDCVMKESVLSFSDVDRLVCWAQSVSLKQSSNGIHCPESNLLLIFSTVSQVAAKGMLSADASGVAAGESLFNCLVCSHFYYQSVGKLVLWHVDSLLTIPNYCQVTCVFVF